MQLLVVGAGASYAEVEQAGLSEQLRPPLINNFAEKMWREYNPHYLLSDYLRQLGHDPGADARQSFIALEKSLPDVNVERFFEYAYNRRDFVVTGHEHFQPASEYDNLLLHGILIHSCFYWWMACLNTALKRRRCALPGPLRAACNQVMQF